MYTRIFNDNELIVIYRNSDFASIGIDERNRDYRAFNSWRAQDPDSARKMRRINMINGVTDSIIEPEIVEAL